MNKGIRIAVLLCGLLLLMCRGQLMAQIDVQHVISIGRNALHFNDYIIAINYFNRAIDARPWMAEPYLYRAIAKISLDDYQGAIMDATLSIDRNPYVSQAYFVQGIAYQQIQDWVHAVDSYRRGLELTPDHEGMHYNLTLSLMRLQRWKEADQASDQMLRFSPKGKEIYSLRAGIALEAQDTTLAIARIDEALVQDSLLSMPYRLRAVIAQERREWRLGIEMLTKAIRLGSEDLASLYANRALMYYQQNDLRKAMSDYNVAIDLEPKHAMSRHNRALLRHVVGEYELAIEDWDVIIELQPSDMIARYNRAMLCISTRTRLPQALDDLNQICQRYPNFSDGFVQRSLLKRLMGDKRGSENDYWHAWDLERNETYKARAIAQAKAIKDRQVRDAKDGDINQHAQFIHESISDASSSSRYSSYIRGRVQDRQVALVPQPIFGLSYFSASMLGDELYRVFHSEVVEDYNKLADKSFTLYLANEVTLTESQIARLQEIVETGGEESVLRSFQRGIAYLLLQDYDMALKYLDQSLAFDNNFALAYYARAIALMRQYEINQSERKETSLSSSTDFQKLDILAIDKALDQTISSTPMCAHAYYARAHWRNTQGAYVDALSDYNQAINLVPHLAEAYYNRGLIYLKLGRIQEAQKDLSQAGELGLYSAYSIIRQIQRK